MVEGVGSAFVRFFESGELAVGIPDGEGCGAASVHIYAVVGTEFLQEFTHFDRGCSLAESFLASVNYDDVEETALFIESEAAAGHEAVLTLDHHAVLQVEEESGNRVFEMRVVLARLKYLHSVNAVFGLIKYRTEVLFIDVINLHTIGNQQSHVGSVGMSPRRTPGRPRSCVGGDDHIASFFAVFEHKVAGALTSGCHIVFGKIWHGFAVVVTARSYGKFQSRSLEVDADNVYLVGTRHGRRI